MINGSLLPDGTKLRRKDFSGLLSHSFMIKDKQIISISEKGTRLGEGLDATAKGALNENGDLIALKIIKNESEESNSLREAKIAVDLGIAGQRTTRESKSPASPIKHYIAYKYLGTDLTLDKRLSRDSIFILCTEIALELNAIHSGSKSNSGDCYSHNDIHWGNIVVRDNKPHFIDFGRSTISTEMSLQNDLKKMLELFYVPSGKDFSFSLLGLWVGAEDYN